MADHYERRQGMRMRDGWIWSNWLPCTEAEAQRVTGLHSWQVRRVCTCLTCGGTGRVAAGVAPSPPTLLSYEEIECIVDEVLTKYPDRNQRQIAHYAADRAQRAVLQRNAGVGVTDHQTFSPKSP